MRTQRNISSRPWHLYALAIVALAVVALAILEIGPPTSSARTSREVVTAEQGVVQSTVTGSGNVEPGTDVDVNFKTGGTLEDVFVSVGQHVTQGQLLATLDPTSAQLTVDQAEEQLTAAEDQLTEVQDGTATGSGSGGSGTGSTSGTSTRLDGASGTTEFVSDVTNATDRTKPTTGRKKFPTTTAKPKTKTETTTTSTPTRRSSSSSSGSGSKTQTTTTTTPSPSSIASAEASVLSAEASLHNAQTALNQTKLYAPTSGTIASMSDLVAGDTVSAGSSTNAASSSSSSSSASTSTGALAGGSSTAGSLGGGSSSSSSGSSSSSPFVEIVNSGTMTMTVAFSESDITKVHVGQPATVTMDALAGVELGAHVTQISDVGTSSSGVVSYNATLTLDQSNKQIRPGMSASASVITSQASGVTVPNAAVTGSGSLGTVNLLENGKTVSQQVVVGLRGDSRTQIISGVRAGQQLVVTITLPSLSSTSTSSTGSTGTLGGAGGFGGGGAGAFLRSGGGAFFRGGGAP